MDYIVYLAGPITGTTYGTCTDWRGEATAALQSLSTPQHRMFGASPMRHKDYLAGETSIEDTYENIVMSSQRGIFARDKFDCTRSNLVLVNLLGATRVSIGTVMEIAWANANNIPLVLVMEDRGNLHDHAMLREACPFRVNTLAEGYEIVRRILIP